MKNRKIILYFFTLLIFLLFAIYKVGESRRIKSGHLYVEFGLIDYVVNGSVDPLVFRDLFEWYFETKANSVRSEFDKEKLNRFIDDYITSLIVWGYSGEAIEAYFSMKDRYGYETIRSGFIIFFEQPDDVLSKINETPEKIFENHFLEKITEAYLGRSFFQEDNKLNVIYQKHINIYLVLSVLSEKDNSMIDDLFKEVIGLVEYSVSSVTDFWVYDNDGNIEMRFPRFFLLSKRYKNLLDENLRHEENVLIWEEAANKIFDDKPFSVYDEGDWFYRLQMESEVPGG